MTHTDWTPSRARTGKHFDATTLGSSTGLTTYQELYAMLLRLGETMNLLSRIGSAQARPLSSAIADTPFVETHAEDTGEFVLVFQRLQAGLRKSALEMLEHFPEPVQNIWFTPSSYQSADLVFLESKYYRCDSVISQESLHGWLARRWRRPRVNSPHRLWLDPPASASPSGFRFRETEWRRKNATYLKAFSGQWVVLEGEKIVAHGRNPRELIEKARSQGIPAPYVFYVEEENQRIANLGL